MNYLAIIGLILLGLALLPLLILYGAKLASYGWHKGKLLVEERYRDGGPKKETKS